MSLLSELRRVAEEEGVDADISTQPSPYTEGTIVRARSRERDLFRFEVKDPHFREEYRESIHRLFGAFRLWLRPDTAKYPGVRLRPGRLSARAALFMVRQRCPAYEYLGGGYFVRTNRPAEHRVKANLGYSVAFEEP